MPKLTSFKTKRETIRVGKYLKEIVTISDSAGKVLKEVVQPLMMEVYPRDVLQMVVGATLLAVPVSFTEEVWKLGATLPTLNILAIAVLSVLFVAMFIHHNFYADHLPTHRLEFIKRVFLTYILALGVSLLILTIIEQVPPDALIIGLKRAVIVSFPASMSAAVADMIK